jgi:hypothetical protein
MPEPARRVNGQAVQPRLDVLVIVLVSLALAVAGLLAQGNIDLNLADEGQLWYVTTRTALGDVPIRDIRSYDPGRYYWGAAWFKLLGPGIISLRISTTFVQALGLFFGLLTLRRVVRRWWLLATLGVLFLAWMYPFYRAYESATVLALVWLAVRLLESPTPARHLAAGVGIGLAAFVRADHGLYAAVAFALLILFRALRERRLPVRDLGAAAAGIVVGYSPMLVMLVAVPGFFGGVVENVAYLVRIVAWNGTANLAKPVPWPWVVSADLPTLERLHRICLGVLFLAVPTLYLLAAVSVVRSPGDDTPGRRLVLAAGFVGVMYAQYTFARPDIEHLAQSFHPLVILVTGLVATLGPRLRARAPALLLPLVVVLSGLTVVVESPVYLWATAVRNPYVQAQVADDVLWMHPGMAAFLDRVRLTADAILAPGDRILVAPHWPALYVHLDRESPLWETYFIVPEPEEHQRRMIGDLERRNVTAVLISDLGMDNRADLSFGRTHPLVYRYLLERYEQIPVDGMPQSAHFLRRKSAAAVAR